MSAVLGPSRGSSDGMGSRNTGVLVAGSGWLGSVAASCVCVCVFWRGGTA